MIIILVLLTLWCAFLATQSSHLIQATLWLAGVSAFTAILFYLIGAWTVAVVELSVGTGLVTVLIVFAITMIGDTRETIAVKRLPLILVLATLILILFFTVPLLSFEPIETQTLSQNLWQNRELDLLAQIALIFSGVIGVLGLLRTAETRRQASSEPLEQPDRQKQEATA